MKESKNSRIYCKILLKNEYLQLGVQDLLIKKKTIFYDVFIVIILQQ